jgi:hypothetical protein
VSVTGRQLPAGGGAPNGLAPSRDADAPADRQVAVWRDPASPDGSGHLSPANPAAGWYGALLLRCRIGPPG